jgi:trans-2,3-dihydro-3-hydroxyanthranilate isomerase
MRHKYVLSDVFTDRMFGGNQLAVFPDAQAVPEDAMQAIARELNLSETVFVLPSQHPECARRLRIFTPGTELPFAGHPTVGTACTLAEIGVLPMTGAKARFAFEEGVGPIDVTVSKNGARFSAQFSVAQLPRFEASPASAQALAEMLSLESDDVINTRGVFPEVVSCGVAFLFVPVKTRDALKRVRLNTTLWERLLAATSAPHVYVFTTDAELPTSSIRARMFAPALGIAEDPATGGAAAPLAGYLAQRKTEADASFAWSIEQGFEMGRPSILTAEADKRNGEITAVRVGGNSLLVGEGVLNLP